MKRLILDIEKCYLCPKCVSDGKNIFCMITRKDIPNNTLNRIQDWCPLPDSNGTKNAIYQGN